MDPQPGEERPADLGQEPAGPFVIAKAGGNPAVDPVQADPVLRAPVSRRQSLQLGQEGSRLSVAAGLGEVVREVVADAEQEAGLPIGVDEAVRLLQGLKGGLHVTLLDVRHRLLDKAPAGAVWVWMLAVEEELHGAGEQLECFGEAALG